MSVLTIHYLILGLLAVAAVVVVVRASRRSSQDVLFDLEEGVVDRDGGISPNLKAILDDELSQAGMYEPSERKRFMLEGKLLPLGGAIIAVGLRLLIAPPSTSGLIFMMIFGMAAGYLMHRSRLSRKKENFIRQIEFYLPVVMERLVMAVQAGLDILPGLKAVIEIEDAGGLKVSKRDPVTKLLTLVSKLTESGLTFEQSLEDVSGRVPCSALRHAFLHLGLAQKEGGELVMPLRELSDSTQLYFQESTEEQIAKMPVKATLPLLCTFGGLIICFLTSPLIQVMELAATAVPK